MRRLDQATSEVHVQVFNVGERDIADQDPKQWIPWPVMIWARSKFGSSLNSLRIRSTDWQAVIYPSRAQQCRVVLETCPR